MANIFQIKDTDNKIGKLVERLKSFLENSLYDGHVYIVGGAVRDLLLSEGNGNFNCKDVDIVVDIPGGGVAFATWLAYRTGCYYQGKNPCIFPTYGTAKVHILTDGDLCKIPIECVQTRKEKYYKDSRNPSTVHGTIEEDAVRRDLTINALYYNITTDEICDFTKMGLDDIKNHIIRTPGDANMVFEDDSLRILRVIRKSAELGWPIEKNTWIGMVTNAKRIDILTQERITEEINRILLLPKPSEAFIKLERCSALQRVLPHLSMSTHVFQDLRPKKTLFQHTLDVIDKTPCVLETRLAALFHDVGKLATYNKGFLFHSKFGADMTEELMKEMKYPNATINTVKKAVEMHEDFSQYTGAVIPRASVIRKFVAKFDGNNKDLEIALDLIHANNISQTYGKKIKLIPGVKQRIEELDKTNESGKKIVLPVNGNELMEFLGIKPGPTLGFIINHIKRKVIEDPTLTKEGAIEYAKKYLEAIN